MLAIHVYPGPGEESLIEGKFLQLVWQGREYLIFVSATRHRYHNQILAQFCADQGIAHRWVTDQRLEVADPSLTVLGGGRFRADARTRTLELWDNSQAYGRFVEHGLCERIAAAEHPWAGYSVTIA